MTEKQNRHPEFTLQIDHIRYSYTVVTCLCGVWGFSIFLNKYLKFYQDVNLEGIPYLNRSVCKTNSCYQQTKL